MPETSESLSHKIDAATQIRGVVRTMKALAASNIGQYERAVAALSEYDHAIQLGLIAYFKLAHYEVVKNKSTVSFQHAIIFGSDQGLVGQFNDRVVQCAIESIKNKTGETKLWAVGERVHSQLLDAGLVVQGAFDVPGSVEAITSLIANILNKINVEAEENFFTSLFLFHNQSQANALYEPKMQKLLPLDEHWYNGLKNKEWTTNRKPEVLGNKKQTLKKLIQEHLFISIFRACAESLASENASRLAAMQRAEKNIEELVARFKQDFHHLRQNAIDEELFDVISGFEAMR